MNAHPSTVRYSILLFVGLFLAGCRSHKSTAPLPTQTSTTAITVSESTQTPTPLPVVLENGWYLYTDPQGEFSFAYPSTALISAGRNPIDLSKNITIQFLVPDKPYQGMSIRVEPNPKGLKGADIAKQLFETSTQKPAAAAFTDSLQQIQVSSVSAVKAVIPSMNTEVTVIIPYDDEVFIVAPVHDLSWTKVETETLDLFYQIINTLKFGDSK